MAGIENQATIVRRSVRRQQLRTGQPAPSSALACVVVVAGAPGDSDGRRCSAAIRPIYTARGTLLSAHGVALPGGGALSPPSSEASSANVSPQLHSKPL